jgi:hypothetical protein
MARGFGATHGSGSTDKIQSALTSHATQRTYAVWTYRAGSGGGNLGRIFAKRTGAEAQVEELLFNSSITSIQFLRVFSGGTGTWDKAAPATNEWHHIIVTYDSGADTNNPEFYYDGSIETPTESSAPVTTANTNTAAYVIGNRGNDNARNWDGRLAEFAIWDRILTLPEIEAVGMQGYSPLFFPNSLTEYIPMVRANGSRRLAIPTITGTAVQPHPKVIYPSGLSMAAYHGEAAGGSAAAVLLLQARMRR